MQRVFVALITIVAIVSQARGQEIAPPSAQGSTRPPTEMAAPTGLVVTSPGLS